MKHLILFLTFVCTSGVIADPISECHNKCFIAKEQCHAKRGHTFNPCDHDLFTCKASCNSGLRQASYSSNPNLDVSFKPHVDFKDIFKLIR